jgi:hypothetical protein
MHLMVMAAFAVFIFLNPLSGSIAISIDVCVRDEDENLIARVIWR